MVRRELRYGMKFLANGSFSNKIYYMKVSYSLSMLYKGLIVGFRVGWFFNATQESCFKRSGSDDPGLGGHVSVTVDRGLWWNFLLYIQAST